MRTTQDDRQVFGNRMSGSCGHAKFGIQDLINLSAPGFGIIDPDSVFQKALEGFRGGWGGKNINPWVSFFHGGIAFDPNQAAHQANDQVGVFVFKWAQ